MRVLACVLGCLLCGAPPVGAQEVAAPVAVSREQLQASIDALGSLDYATRTNASRTIRRTPTAQAVPALIGAAAEHADGYVRYRALVLLTGFNDSRADAAMRAAIESPNDRLRTVAYGYFEHHPSRDMAKQLLDNLEREQAEFVRPALVRALASIGDDERVRAVLTREAGRGEDFFRSVVIEALGDYKARYAFDTLRQITTLDGPLLDDAALALGKVGDKRAFDVLAGLQRTAPRTAQPFIAAGLCLLGTNCESHEAYLKETLRFASAQDGFQELLRGATAGLGALAVAGRPSAAEALFDAGIPAPDPTRAPVAIAVATIAMRNPPLMMSLLERHARRADAIALVAEGFDMLEEDLEKERFFAFARHAYWDAAEGSPVRALVEALIVKLDF